MLLQAERFEIYLVISVIFLTSYTVRDLSCYVFVKNILERYLMIILVLMNNFIYFV